MATLTSLWRLHIWIACFAILLNGLAPSISHAIAAARGDTSAWQICRADGSRYEAPTPALAESGGPIAPAKQDKMQAGEHCAYCLPHGASFALPPDAISAFGVFAHQRIVPLLFYRSPQPLTAWSAARPRGPPALA
ncbi:DUF2946 domain-containing protein [Janthinobacterium sp.]|uniref:DUF2946 domain-containing protein n=1 Tax=Janthinobacterium sp. TaxID=1871054 RepID=UPI00293D4AC5|nr:DUF2946 domain-containing protein [Janthinobacterium sp.]